MNGRILKVVVAVLLGLVGHLAHAGTHHYYYTDPQGTVLAKADAGGTIIATYDYAPYGVAVASMSQAPNGPGYTGHVNDPESGFVYMQARYYDPAVGRFLSVDPNSVAVGTIFNINRYDYSDNNPINKIDPTGMYTCDRKKNQQFCEYVDKLVKHLDESKNAYKSNSREYRIVTLIMKYVGAKDVGGPNYVPGDLSGDTAAQTNQNGTTTLDINKGVGDDVASSEIGHEAQHDLDTTNWKTMAGKTDDRKKAEAQYRRTENNAYRTQSIILGGFGKTLNSDEIVRDVEGSVFKEMSAWDRAHGDEDSNENH